MDLDKLASHDSLPNELLVRIFDLLLPLKTERKDPRQTYSMGDKQRRTMVSITHTCARWRRLAHSTPTLWTHIHLTFWEPVLSYARHCISLSRDLPLVVYFYPGWHAVDERISLSTLLGDFSRVRKLTIHALWPSPSMPAWDRPSGDAPILEILEITDLAPNRDSPHTVQISFTSTPSLKTLTLGVWAPNLVPSCLYNLTSMRIRIANVNHPEGELAIARYIKAAPPQLQELVVGPDTSLQPSYENHITPLSAVEYLEAPFPSLRRLVLAGLGWDSNRLRAILASLRIPDTCTRHITARNTRLTNSQPLNVVDLVQLGRMEVAPRSTIVRKLRTFFCVGSGSYFSVTGDTITLTGIMKSFIHKDDPSRPMTMARLLSEVTEFHIIAPYDRFGCPGIGDCLDALFPILPSLCKVVISTNEKSHVLGAVVGRLTKVKGGFPPGFAFAPLLEEVQLLYYNPGQHPRSATDSPTSQLEGPLLVRLAEERKRIGRGLKRVTLERCEPAVEWALKPLVKDIASVRRWVGGLSGYPEDDIFESQKSCERELQD